MAEGIQTNNPLAPILTSTKDLLHAESYCNRDVMKYSSYLLANRILAQRRLSHQLTVCRTYQQGASDETFLAPSLFDGLIPSVAMEAHKVGESRFPSALAAVMMKQSG